MKSAKWFLLMPVILASAVRFLHAATCDSYSLKLTYLNIGTWPNESDKLKWGQGLSLSLFPSGASDIHWTVPEGTIKDYDERIQDNLNEPSSIPSGFEKTKHKDLDLNSDSISLYFRRETKQVLEADRKVTLSFLPADGAVPCKLEKHFNVTVAPKPIELYTSDHLSQNKSNLHMGRVVEDHFIWHSFHLFTYKKVHKHPSFLHWHHLYLNRYEAWLKLFGYEDLKPIYPSGSFTQHELYQGHEECTTYKFTGISAWDKKLEGAESFDKWEKDIVDLHDKVHEAMAANCKSNKFGTFAGISSPKSELFWRFHKALDEIHYVPLCFPKGKEKPSFCPKTGDD